MDKNDTSVIVVTDGSTAHFQYDTFVKYGYSSNLLEASFYGVNAAVWVGNASTAYISDSNVTVHNGAANIYVYGTDTVVYADNLWLYSSGPVSHGLYAAGNGTVYATNIEHYSGAYRSSAFSGDSPGGYVHVSDSIAHTDGHGSAICYALGLCNITNVIGHASSAPVMFMDSDQEGIWTDCDLTAGDLAGMVLFGSAARESGAELTLDHSKLTVLGDTMASLWFGNTIATVTIKSSVFNNSASDIFVISNISQVTQDFTYLYVVYLERADLHTRAADSASLALDTNKAQPSPQPRSLSQSQTAISQETSSPTTAAPSTSHSRTIPPGPEQPFGVTKLLISQSTWMPLATGPSQRTPSWKTLHPP